MAAAAAAAIFTLLFWPVLLGLFVSLAIVGKGLRLVWLPLALAIFVLIAGVLSMLLHAFPPNDPSGLFGVAVLYVSGALLVPAGHYFRKWWCRKSVIEAAKHG
jgi:hypothetical protein